MERHFQAHLGKRLRTIRARRGVRVLVFPSPVADDVVLATDGARAVPGPRSQRPIELVMACRPGDVEACARLLCDLAHYPGQAGAALGGFHALPLGRSIVPRSRLTSLLLTLPWFGKAEFSSARVERRRVTVLQVIPITAAEHDLFQASGAEALEERLEDRGCDLANLRRRSCA
jgi:hypothetical protein